MATAEELKRKREQAANASYGAAIDASVPVTVGRAIANTTPYQFGESVRGGMQDKQLAVTGAIERQAQRGQAARQSLASNIEEGARTPTGVGEFWRGVTGQAPYQPPARTQPAARTAPAAQPASSAITSAGSEDRIRAIANEGRVPDNRAAPAVIDRPAAMGNRALFVERPAGERSAYAPNIEGTDRTGFAATTGEMQRYNEYRSGQQADSANDVYQRELLNTTLSSGDSWFDFMQKNQQRAAIISSRKSAMEGEKLASGERMQERRGEIEGALQDTRLGAESGMLDRRLSAAEKEAGAQRDFDRPFKEGALRSQEADIEYKGALGEESGARGAVARMQVEDAQRKQALMTEYETTKDPVRRNRIAQILQGGAGQKSELPGFLKEMLGVAGPKEQPKLMAAYADAVQAANSPTSPFFGNPEGAFALIIGDVQGGGESYAMGGVVEAEGYAEGGAVQMGVQMPQVDETATLAKMYTQYVQSTQSMGATPVDFNQFSTLMTTVRDRMAVPAQGQDPNAMGMPGYAQGGAVDVSGQQVLGPGTGTSDSIPAIIDGHAPAALSTNEFVWTANATENASPAVLKAVMSGLERNDPEIVSGIMALAAKAVKKPAQPAVE